MYKFFLAFIMLFSSFSINAQLKPVKKIGEAVRNIEPIKKSKFQNNTNSGAIKKHTKLNTLGKLTATSAKVPFVVEQIDRNKMPILIKGTLQDFEANISRQASDYLHEIAHFFQVENSATEWEITSIEEDQIGMHHIRVQQQLNDVQVFAGELILHAKNGRIESMTGRGFPTPELNTSPSISAVEAERSAVDHLKTTGTYKEISAKNKKLFGLNQIESELVIYHEEDDARKETLVYHFKIYENLASLKSIFIDAHSGEIIHDHDLICKLHTEHLPPPDGPTTATATDLNGSNRTINTYEISGDFILVDASRPMFNGSQSTLPNEPVGAIWTLDGFDNTPQGDNFDLGHVVSSNNQWANAKAVSAHFNAGVAYEYFKDVHGRNSINGSGGNIMSIINVTDEDDNSMDNAFWNGVAMFYGNGAQDFFPLAGGLDVAGHEMSHGVIQASANLRYQGESGALNESFADIFGVMMDRDDYKIGEDVVKLSSFPTGALRDMANPNNGGNSLGDRGWQPAHTNEQYFGSLDEGGVHINSGIVNKAFHLLAEAIGKAKAEQIYYRALTQYLTQSSQFVDARNAVVMSASDLYSGTEADAARSAFSAVGIGEGSGGNYQNNAGENPGEDFIIFANADKSSLKIANGQLDIVLDPASLNPPKSKPSVTDDGSIIVFVNQSNQIEEIIIDWDSGNVNREILQDQEIWDNVVISKDGNRIAAVQMEAENKIQIFDFGLGAWYAPCATCDLGFILTNPTFTEGISTGDVKYADAMEFDISGEILLYDAYSEITSSQGQTVGYWDIAFMNVFDNAAGNWSNGNIGKLFGQLADGISIGNPTFAKNSPYIVAFDYIEGDELAILGVNIETGDVGEIYENSSLSYPSYTGTDQQLIFTTESVTAGPDIAILDLNDDKISRVQGTTGILIEDGQLATAFRNGTRALTGSEDLAQSNQEIVLFPNPSADFIFHKYEAFKAQEAIIEVVNVDGKTVITKKVSLQQGVNKEMIDVHNLSAGNYIINLNGENLNKSAVFSKI